MLLLLVGLNWNCGGRGGDKVQGRVADTGLAQTADTGMGRDRGQAQNPGDTVVDNQAMGVYSNGTLTRKEIVLPDGTKVTVHAGTSVRIAEKFDKGDREMWLDGDALFEVSEGSVGNVGKSGGAGMGKPVIIHTGNLRIEVLAPGSRFRVDARKKEAGEEVDLLAGKLRVMKSYHSDTDNEPDTIVAGEMVMINREIDLMEKEKMDGSEMKGWDLKR
jgi:ferric-dicitrate binding protein FerR (iron transport regulator)